MTTYKYIATATTPASEHISEDRVMEGEIYLISKHEDPNFVRITGKIFNRNGGFRRLEDKAIQKSKVEKFVKRVK